MAKQHLTDRFVKYITPRGARRFIPDASGRIEIGDLKVEGLCLRIKHRGLKTWCFLYRSPIADPTSGKHMQRRLTLGKWPTVSLSMARQLAMEAREQIWAGIDPKDQGPEVLTLREMCEAYVQKSLRGRVKDYKSFQLRMEKHVLSCWGDRPASDITRGDVHQLLDVVKEIGPAAARNIRKHLHAMYVWAVDREFVAVNPLYRLRRDDLAPPKDVRTPLTDKQIRAVWNLDVPVGPQLRLLLLMGCRKVEVGTSRWEQYDVPNRVFIIPAERHKGGRETVIPLCQPALDILADIPRNGSEVFGPRGYLDCDRLKPAYRALRWRLRPHDLRATVATRMAALRVPPNIIQLCLGQSIKGLLPIYSKYDYLEEKREAFEKYGQHIKEVIG